MIELADLFPSGDFAFRMGLRRGDPAELLRPGEDHRRVLAERRRWLREEPAEYLAPLPKGEPLLEDMLALFCEWGMTMPDEDAGPLERLRLASEQAEPDLVLLSPGEQGEMHVVGGAVCFPSAWSLAEKIGRPMSLVHGPAPTLNEALGKQIGAALAGLRRGAAWLRQNWSLTAIGELNQHPARNLPRLKASATLADTWLRVERQGLVSLPRFGGILFLIRIEMEPLASIKARASREARALAQALVTMPLEIARYKSLADARASLIAQLEA